MVTIVIGHVTGVYLITVIGNLVFIQTQLDVNLEGYLEGRLDVSSVIKVYQRYVLFFLFSN